MHILYTFANKTTPNVKNWHVSILFSIYEAQTSTDQCFPYSLPLPIPLYPQQLCALR